MSYANYGQMTGPIMSNMHHPGTPMAVVNGIPGTSTFEQRSGLNILPGTSSYTTNTIHQDRPFGCDQCPQSFNRNHDLKRHKRIHLAVKPFPCAHCEKSFSRKDALKVSQEFYLKLGLGWLSSY
jgi:uncharacterized Zn-finger protein